MRRRTQDVAAVDRHADKVAALRRAVLESDGVTAPAVRGAAAAGGDLPAPLVQYLAKVREASFRITDADVAGLKTAGYGEEEIFELTVAAALGAALQRHDAGLAALLDES
jgi:alkylhydroperoxidase family enzyme